MSEEAKKPLRILVVDDSNVMRRVVAEMVRSMEEYSIEVFEAENGHKAQEVLQICHLEDHPVQLVLSDWMMPEMSGIEFLESIRAVEHFKDLGVCMLTAETYQSQMARCIELGVFAYITKPFTREELTGVVEKYIKERILTDNNDEKKAS